MKSELIQMAGSRKALRHAITVEASIKKANGQS
jgi:hypothetical protein